MRNGVGATLATARGTDPSAQVEHSGQGLDESSLSRKYVDFVDPILKEPLKIENGQALIPTAPGIGISWDEAGVRRYLNRTT